MRFAALLLSALLMSGAVRAEVDAAATARQAAKEIEAASISLQKAKTSRNRVKALTQTVQAYEAGLAALREGLRQAAIREKQLSGQLKAQEDDISRLLGVLQNLGNGASPTVFLHPDGPEGTARAGMILADIAPALDAEANVLRQTLQTELHHDFKRANGYSDLEIAQKRSAIEDVLVPESESLHIQRLKDAGFSQVIRWYQCFNFASYLAIK